MIQTLIWTAQDLRKWAALTSAAKGLSLFAMVVLTEEDVVEIQQALVDLANATSVSISEHKIVQSKVVPLTPTDADRFLLMLKWFTNLLFALFLSQCPQYIQMYSIVKALRNYLPTA